MAKRHKGVSSGDLERYWKDAEKAYDKLSPGRRKKIGDKNAYLMGTVLKRIKAGTGKKYKKQEALDPSIAFVASMLCVDEDNVDAIVQALETTTAVGVTTGAPAGTRDDDEEETDSTTARLGPAVVHRQPQRYGYPK